MAREHDNQQLLEATRATAEPPGLESAEDGVSRLIASVDLEPLEGRYTFSSGREVVLQGATQDRLVVRSPAGQIELSVRFTEQGPVLSFSGAAIDLVSPGAVTLDCGSLRVRARDGIALETSGDIEQNAKGALRGEADDVSLRSRVGDLKLAANDDVIVEGERIRLN
jgi:hypothetical protein